jgi:periplasmic divalent cation tolerance protein
MEKSEIIAIEFTTGFKKEAKKIVNTLLEKKLIACANITPCESIYWWEGKIETAHEYMVSAKTLNQKADKAINLISKIHSYEAPVCIVKKCQAEKNILGWIQESIMETTTERKK